jgi:hypothetical protein
MIDEVNRGRRRCAGSTAESGEQRPRGVVPECRRVTTLSAGSRFPTPHDLGREQGPRPADTAAWGSPGMGAPEEGRRLRKRLRSDGRRIFILHPPPCVAWALRDPSLGGSVSISAICFSIPPAERPLLCPSPRVPSRRDAGLRIEKCPPRTVRTARTGGGHRSSVKRALPDPTAELARPR